MRSFWFVFSLLSCLSLSAQELSITGKIDRSQIQVGEQAAIDLVVRTSDIAQTIINVPKDSLQDFTILAYQVLDTVIVDQRIKEIRARMVLTAWDSCLLSVPPIEVRLGSKQASAGPFVLKVVEPEVNLSKPDSIAEIKKPWALPYTLMDIFWIVVSSPFFWIFITLCFLALIALGLHLYLKARRERKPIPIIPLVPAIDRALAAIDRTASLPVSTEIECKVFFTELTDICRAYLKEEAAIQAPEMTSSELLEAVRFHLGTESSTQTLAMLRVFLEQSDWVKFARFIPSCKEIKESVQYLRDFLIDIDQRLKAERVVDQSASKA